MKRERLWIDYTFNYSTYLVVQPNLFQNLNSSPFHVSPFTFHDSRVSPVSLIFATMIAYLEGRFVYKSPSLVHLDVNGVGYELQVSLNTYSSIQGLDKGILRTYLHIREDAHTLFGFYDQAEKDIFIQLLSVSGVGATTARMMLSYMKPEELVRAITSGDSRTLEGIKGIGRKTAERIVLELRDKVGKSSFETNISPMKNNTLHADALNALLGLGVARNSADQVIQKVMRSDPSLTSLEDIIKRALKNL